MKNEEFKQALLRSASLYVGDVDGEAPLVVDPAKEVDYRENPDDPEVRVAKTPWLRASWARDINGNKTWLPNVEFPKMGEIARQDWLGGNVLDEQSARLDAFGYTEFGNDPNAIKGWTPDASLIIKTADEYGLSERHFGKLASARSEEDMKALASAYQERQNREARIANSNTGVGGFVTRVGVNAFDPAFLLAGGGTAQIFKVGASSTRTGNAIRAGLAGGAADAPLELLRAGIDPDTSVGDAATAVLASVVLSGAFGGLQKGIDADELVEIDEAIADGLENYQGSSVGAKQAKPVIREVDRTPLNALDDAPERAGFHIFGTPLNYLSRSLDAGTRKLSDMLSWNPNTRSRQGTTAFEAQRRVYESGAAYVRQARMAAVDYFNARNALGRTGAPTSEQLDEFFKIVAQVHAGVRKSDDPAINRAVAAYRDGYEDTLKYVKDRQHVTGRQADELEEGDYRGIDDFRDIEHDPAYVYRRFSADGYNRVSNDLKGPKGVASALAKVIFRSNRTWLSDLSKRMGVDEYALARKIANKYVATVDGLTNPAMRNSNPHRPVRQGDREAAREVVREVFNDGDVFAENVEDAIEMILDLVAPQKKKAADSPRARPRVRLDLDATEDARLLDMFDWNAEALFTTYRRQLSGHAGLLRAGFNSVPELNAEITKIRKRSSGDPRRQGRASREASMLEDMRDAILGVPPEELMKRPTWTWTLGQIKKQNYGNLMGNTGFLALSEIAGVLVRTGPLRLFRQFPEFRKYYKLARSGDPEVVSNLFHLADVVMGHGSSQLRSRLQGFSNRYEGAFEDLIDPMSKAQEKFGTYNRKQANLVSRMSGMGPLQEWLRMSIVTGEAQDFVKFARKGKMPYSVRRMAAMGIDEDMWQRMSAQLRKMDEIESPDTGKPRPNFDLDAWDDADALDAFINALDRNARRVVMEGDLGHQALVMRNSPLMQLLFQFLNFPINAASKHLGFAFNVKDTRAVAEVLAMSMGGGLGYMARVRAQAEAIADEEEREKFLEERWTMAEMAKASFYYSAHASLIPNAIDLPLGVLSEVGVDGVDPFFNNSRASGLAADPFLGNATRSRFYSMLRSGGGLFTDQPGSEEDVKKFVTAWAPMGNHVLTQAFLNRTLDWLPEEEEEED